MLRLILDLHGVNTKQRQAIGELLVWNESKDDSREVAQYGFLIKHEGVDGVHRIGEGVVLDHKRSKGAWELVRRCLSQEVEMETHSTRLLREIHRQLADRE